MTFRNLATALLLSLLLATPAFAADETLPNLSAAAPAAGTDLVPTTQGGSLLKQTLSAILTYIEGAFQKASAAQFGVVEVRQYYYSCQWRSHLSWNDLSREYRLRCACQRHDRNDTIDQ